MPLRHVLLAVGMACLIAVLAVIVLLARQAGDARAVPPSSLGRAARRARDGLGARAPKSGRRFG